MIIYQPTVPLSHTPIKVAFITGLSNPASCSLSWEYQQFMANLNCPEPWKIYLNFPYIPNAENKENGEEKDREDENTDNKENISLLKASLANFRQFLWAPSPRYREAAQRHLMSAIASADTLFFVVGSCGLEILNQAWTEAIAQNRVRIMALGPVARNRPRADCTLIQGTRDYISRLFFSDVDVVIPNTGHMGYVSDRRVFDLVSQSLGHTIANL